MVRVIRIIFTMMKIIMMIIIKSEILLMITTILKMMVFTVSHACMRVKHVAEKDGFKMIDLIFAGKGCEVWARLVTPTSLPGFVNVYQKHTPPLFQQVRAHV